MGITQHDICHYRKDGCRLVQDKRGQMTVEFVAVFPVLLIVTVIATNALLFFSECAAFDVCAKDAVRIYATSPAYGQTVEQSRAQIELLLSESFDAEYLDFSVAVAGGAEGFTTYTATLHFSPTLFGLGLRSDVFGVTLPQLTHSTSLTVDTYKSGVII